MSAGAVPDEQAPQAPAAPAAPHGIGRLRPVDVYEASLDGTPVLLRTHQGHAHPLPAETYLAEHVPGDSSLLTRCTGGTLDVGCGPGRLAAALTRRGVRSLGIDISLRAVALARAAGADALHGSIFDPLPQVGPWSTALLADGNLGIGGEPVTLLARLRTLLTSHGQVLVELDPPGSGAHQLTVRLEHADGAASVWFPWARVGVEAIDEVAMQAGLSVVERWSEAGRWFAALGARPLTAAQPRSRSCSSPLGVAPATTT